MKYRADKNWVIAIAIHMAINGDLTLLQKLEREQIEKWNGYGI